MAIGMTMEVHNFTRRSYELRSCTFVDGIASTGADLVRREFQANIGKAFDGEENSISYDICLYGSRAKCYLQS